MLREKYMLIVFGLFILLSTACSRDEADSNEEEAAVSAVPVKVLEVTPDDIDIEISGTGTIKPYHETMISSEVNGNVIEVLIEVGDVVKKNQILVNIDNELISLALEQANAQLLNTSANYEKAKKDRERFEKLREDNDISEYEYENSVLQEKVTRAAYLSADAAKKSTERQLRNTKIKSPIDGRIAEKFVDIGQMVSPGTPVVKVIDIDRVKVEIEVSEDEVIKIKKGQSIMLAADVYPGVEFTGEVLSVSPQASLNTRTYPVEVVVPNNRENELKSGMIVRVNIRTGSMNNVVMIPRDAILERDGKRIAFTVDNGKARQKQLELGVTIGNRVLVKRGISPGEQLVIVGHHNLIDGSNVRVNGL